MKKLLAAVAAGGTLALVATALALATAQSTIWTAPLSSGQEVPKQVVKTPNAHGLFKATLKGTQLKWKLTYAKLSGPAMAAHIHKGAKGKSGNVLVPLCGASPVCKSGLTGTATLTQAEITWFKKHLLYVNVHTAKNPNGEIRGQLALG
jgi:hypothetical protein